MAEGEVRGSGEIKAVDMKEPGHRVSDSPASRIYIACKTSSTAEREEDRLAVQVNETTDSERANVGRRRDIGREPERIVQALIRMGKRDEPTRLRSQAWLPTQSSERVRLVLPWMSSKRDARFDLLIMHRRLVDTDRDRHLDAHDGHGAQAQLYRANNLFLVGCTEAYIHNEHDTTWVRNDMRAGNKMHERTSTTVHR